ncbi:uncharacterized protein LOC112083372 [Eutrema salsugineum]|uniref:uncharacterized protein LOC112083372 n=1 Tax=Eutrema salsugineum TaxID=72664 RepID=UPI000CECFA5A|nr:uncharacterized protein LOC112083372 [Eutrema salsugineum]
MKLKLALASLSRALPFSNLSREVTVARAKRIENGVGLKYLTTSSTSREPADAEFATAKTSVWWDFENCMVPKGCDGHKIALNIKSALEKNKYCGPLTIGAYGDTNKIPSSVQNSLSSTGVSLIHVPPGVKDGSDKKILVDMLLCAMENPAPANMMLISGDGDFSYVLHRLRMMGYNVLLVRPDQHASPFLIAAANTMWLWRSIVAGGSCTEVPKQAEPSKGMSSDLAVKSKSGQKSCETCKVTCTSEVDLNSHLSSKKHKQKTALVASQSAHAKVKPKTMWCGICQVHYPTDGHEEHISGRGHKNKLKVQAA